MLRILKSATPCCTILLLKEMHGLILCENYCWRNKIQDTFSLLWDSTDIYWWHRSHEKLKFGSQKSQKGFLVIVDSLLNSQWCFLPLFSLSVITLSITQSYVLSRTGLVLTAPLASCPMLFFFFFTLSIARVLALYLLVFSAFLQSVSVHLHPSFLQGWIPRLLYALLIPTGSPSRTPSSSSFSSFCASNHPSLVSLNTCSKYYH